MDGTYVKLLYNEGSIIASCKVLETEPEKILHEKKLRATR